VSRPDGGPRRVPSRVTVWSPGTATVHRRAKRQLGADQETQTLRHEDLGQDGLVRFGRLSWFRWWS
jgi:hypothetical protein